MRLQLEWADVRTNVHVKIIRDFLNQKAQPIRKMKKTEYFVTQKRTRLSTV